MPQKNNIDFNLNFKQGDVSALDKLKRDLKEIRQLAADSNFAGGFNPSEIKNMVNAANTLEMALNSAFDPKLNTMNIQKFNKILVNSGLNAKNLQQYLSTAGAAGERAFIRATGELLQFNRVAKQSNEFLDHLSTSFFNSMRYTAFSAILNNISSGIQGAYNYVEKLDSGLNDIRIVTGKSADEMARFATEANNAAKQLAVTTQDYVEGSLIYYQQGLDDETVKTLTDITAKTSNVTKQSMQAVSEELTAVWNGYQVANQAAEEGMQVYEEYVDKMAAVGAATASDLEELSTAMSKVASAASSMGVTFDDLNAQIATIVSATRQAPESVGTALKTIYARLGDLKVDGVDEFGTKLGEVSSQLKTMGIDILDTNGEMRDMSSVMADVATKWNTWNSAQKQAAAVAMAGKRQYNNLVALFENWDKYTKTLNTSMEASGTLEQQQMIALDSLANKTEVLKATAEDLYDSLFDEDAIKGLVEGLTKVVQLMADFADATGGLTTLLPVLGALGLKVFKNQIADSLSTIVMNINNSKDALAMQKQNMAELQAMFKDIAINNNTYASNEGVQEMVDYYGKMKDYLSIMTEEEIEQYKATLAIKQEAAEYENTLKGLSESFSRNNKSIKIFDENLVLSGKDAAEVYERVVKIKSLMNDLSIEAKEGAEARRKRAENIISDYVGKGLDQDQANNLIKKLRYYTSRKGSSSAIGINHLTEDLDEVTKLAKGIQDTANAMDNAREKAEILGNTLEDKLNLKAKIVNITNLVGALGQASMAIMSFKNIVNILKNDDLDFGDKLLQTFMNLSFVVPQAAAAINTFSKALSASVSLEKEQLAVEEAQAAAEKAKTAFKEAQTAKEAALQSGVGVKKAQNQAVQAGIALEAAENSLTEESVALNAKKNLLGQNGIIIKAKETVATLFHAKALKAEGKEELVAIALKNAYIAAALAAVAAVALIANAIKKQHEAQIEATKSSLEEVEATQERIKANEELYDSYKKLYDVYKENGKVTNELYDTTIKMAEAYDIVGAKVLALGGYYDELNKKINDAKKEELEKSIETAKEGASNAAFLAADKGRTSNYSAEQLVTEFGQPRDRFLKSRHVLGPAGFKDDPHKMLEYIDAQREDIKFVDSLSEEEQKAYKDRYDDTKEEYSKLSEYGEKLRTQLNTQLTSEVQLELIDYDAEDTNLTELYNKAKEIKEKLSEEGFGEEEIEKTISETVENVDALSAAKINIALQLDDKDALKEIDKMNTSQLALLQVHLDKGILTEDLDTWLENYKPLITLSGQLGSQSTFKSLIEGYDKDKGLGSEAPNTIYNSEVSKGYMGVDEDTFKGMDQAAQVNEVTIAYLKNTAEIEKNKDAVKEQLKELENQQGEYEKTIEETEIASEEVNDFIVRTATLDDSQKEAVENALIKYSTAKNGLEDLEDHEQYYITQLIDEGKIDEDRLKATGELLAKNKQATASFETIEKEIEKLTDSTFDYKTAMQGVTNAVTATNSSLDDIQTNYKNLIGIVEDYNQTGAFTIDAAQQLMTMSSQYVAQLQFEGNQLSLNEEGIKAITLAKLDEMRTEAELQYQVELTRIAQIAMDDEMDASAKKTALMAQQLEALGIAASNSSEGLMEAATAMAAINGSGNSDLIAAADQATKAYENRLKAIQSVRDQVNNGGYGLRKAMGASSSKSNDKELKKLDDEFDRYWQIKKAIDAVDKSVKQLDFDQQKLHNKELIASLEKENDLLKKQKANYEDLAREQRVEAGELQGLLSSYGVGFDSAGGIANYAEATKAALDKYNNAISAHNRGAIDDVALDTAEKSYNEFKKALERYSTLYYSEMEDTAEKIRENNRKILENNLQSWEIKIQLKLDTKEFERDWNKFLKTLNDDFKKVYKNISTELSKTMNDVLTFDGKSGTITADTQAIYDVTKEIDKLKNGISSDFFESVSDAQDKLKSLYQQLESDTSNFRQQVEDAWDLYIEGINQTSDRLDFLNGQYERINDTLNYQKQLIELLYGEDAYDLLGEYYKSQESTSSSQIQSLKQQADMWEQLWKDSGATLENQAQWTEDQQTYYDKMVSAQKDLHSLTIDYINLLKNDYLNTINSITEAFEKAITNGSSLEDVSTEWERISANAEKYYDSVEGAYKIQTLANNMDKEIAATSDTKAQAKLNALREKEITYLREKKDLTQYDLDAANARYQIALKEIALEEAQNNKTSMKLTRNEQGNWSYQYVADEDQISTARQDLLNSWNDLYQLASDAYEKNLKSLQDLQTSYLESVKEIAQDTTLTEEEKASKLKELNNQYYEDYNRLAGENALYRQDLEIAASGLLLELYNQDEESYKAMTEEERKLVDALIQNNISDYMNLELAVTGNLDNIGDKATTVMETIRQDWQSKAQELANYWNADDGVSVKAQQNAAMESIIQASEKYRRKLEEAAESVGEKWGEDGLVGTFKDLNKATDNARDAVSDYVDEALDNLPSVRAQVQKIVNVWNNMKTAIENAARSAKNYITDLDAVTISAKAAEEAIKAVNNAQKNFGSGSGDGSGSGGTSSDSNSGGNYKFTPRYAIDDGWTRYTDPNGVSGTYALVKNGKTQKIIQQSQLDDWLKKNGYIGWGNFYSDNLTGMKQFASGGYTGSWDDSSGRVAMLHQKELVLNQEDTSNFLSGISMIRDMSAVNGSINDAIVKSVANMMLSLKGLKPGTIKNIDSTSSVDNNVFNITAEFPNANDVNEIREAILSLPNIASQYASQNTL